MSRNLCRTFFTASRFLHKDFVSKVPGMGDSITEGSLIKLVAKLGALVKQDEIVAVIETDKVSVDVRSPHAGVLKSYHAALNDTVAVGAPLFTLDTDATVGSSAAAPSASAAAAAPAPTPVAKAAAAAAAAQPLTAAHVAGRVPSIHFRHGVRDAAPAASASKGAAAASSSTAPSASATSDYTAMLQALYPSKKGALPELSRAPAYGRPALTPDMEHLINSGGAYGAPPPPPPAKGKK